MTFKELVLTFEDIVSKHLQIKSFYFNETWELGQNHDILYPAFQLEQAILVNHEVHIENYNIAFNVIDRSYEDLSERINVLSNLKQIGDSIIAYLRKHTTLVKEDANFNFTCIPYQEAQMDRVWGWRYEIQLELKSNINKCILPFTDEIS